MNEIWVIGKSRELENFLKKIKKFFGNDLDFKYIDVLNSVSMGFPGPLFVEVTEVDNLETFVMVEMASKDVPVYLVMKDEDFLDSAPRSREIRKISSECGLVEGIINISRPVEFSIPMVRQVIKNREYRDTLEQFVQVGQSLSKAVGNVLGGMQKFKQFHERMVPIEQRSINGLQILSKFNAGNAPGGEFFDVVYLNDQALIFLTSSNSYVISSVVMTHFDSIRKSKDISRLKLEQFLLGLASDLEDKGLVDQHYSNSLEVFCLKMDLLNMFAESYHFGAMELISSKGAHFVGNSLNVNELNLEKAYYSFKIDKAENFVVISSGVLKNCKGEIDGSDYLSYLREQIPKTEAKAFLHELFFQLKRDHDGLFLGYDASAIYIKVE